MNSVVTQASPPVYGQVERYINRELSILDFNLRVLEQAVDPLNPLLEKLNFLLIFSRNLDEFFEIRVATMLEHFVQERDIQTLMVYPHKKFYIKFRRQHMLRLNANIKF